MSAREVLRSWLASDQAAMSLDEIDALHTVLEESAMVETECTLCGTMCLDYRQRGDERACIVCVSGSVKA